MRNIDFDKFSEHSLVLRNYAKNFDIQLLEEIENIVKQKEFSNGLGWYKWDWNDTAKELGFGKRPVEGFIAQEVQSVLPNAVATYTDFIPNMDKKCINIQWLPISDSSNNSTDISDNFGMRYTMVSCDLQDLKVSKLNSAKALCA